jgi:hypothetical protein
MNDASIRQIREQAALLEKLGVQPNELKKKHRVGIAYVSHKSTNNSGRRDHDGKHQPGWRKHGKGPQNAPFNA